MGTFVQDGVTFVDRTDATTPTGVTTEIAAVVPNTLKGAVLDLRTAVYDVINARSYGVVCDGATNDYTALAAMLTTVGSRKVTLLIPGNCVVGTNITIPSTTVVRFEAGGQFSGAGVVTYTAWGMSKIALNAGATEWIGGSAAGIPGAQAWQVPTLLNSWVNLGGSYSTASYYRDVAGIVHLRGCIKSGTMTSAALTLPVGYRPSSAGLLQFAVVSNGLLGVAQVGPTGDVIPVVGTNASFFLDGVSFRAEQ